MTALRFTNIREAEARHIEALRTLFQRYELEMPENTWPGRVPHFGSTREACEAGIEAEVANAALYDRLMRSTSRQDIRARGVRQLAARLAGAPPAGVGLIDRESGLGQTYFEHQADSVFYREATFYSADEVGEMLRSGGFAARAWGQTLFRPLAEIADIEPVRPGTGVGAFVVVTADRIAHGVQGHSPSTSLKAAGP